uniref:Uncharacterized protein n=1 Tax=Cacopsylla melanoneura TaxID=428564 RepID=A0A8D8ZQB0_9HEMI
MEIFSVPGWLNNHHTKHPSHHQNTIGKISIPITFFLFVCFIMKNYCFGQMQEHGNLPSTRLIKKNYHTKHPFHHQNFIGKMSIPNFFAFVCFIMKNIIIF